MPSVLTMPQAAAEQLLTNDGFLVKVRKGASSLGSGFVYNQSPNGRRLPRAAGSTVTIWVTN